MKFQSTDTECLANEIRATDGRLHSLEKEIGEIPGPASADLRKRLTALQIEERALKRNFSELFGKRATLKSEAERKRKVESLVHRIEEQEAALEHDAHFLHQGAPSSVTWVVGYGARLIDRGTRRLRKALGDKLWFSPFVNNTHETLARRFDAPEPKDGVAEDPEKKADTSRH